MYSALIDLSSSHAFLARKDEDKDPVISEYDIFITPAVAERVFVLQYPLRMATKPYNRRNGASPQEMRMKQESGFVELDVDMDPVVNFNKSRGIEWGKAMQQAKASGLTTFGASAGFGPGNIKSDGRRARVDDYAPDIDSYSGSKEEGKVFRKQTLGGQILSAEDGRPQYMLGTFRGRKFPAESPMMCLLTFPRGTSPDQG